MSEAKPLALVVDDEVQIRRFLRAGLELDGFAVEEAESGSEALRSATLQPPDLVILDLGLPDMDGSEVLERLRGWSTVPVIVLSAVGDEEQKSRFEARIEDPLRQWKLSPMDIESYRRWYDYSRARDVMFKATHSKHAPWHIIRSDDKRQARLNCIAHLLEMIPYQRVREDKVRLPKRSQKGRYNDQAGLRGMTFLAERY